MTPGRLGSTFFPSGDFSESTSTVTKLTRPTPRHLFPHCHHSFLRCAAPKVRRDVEERLIRVLRSRTDDKRTRQRGPTSTLLVETPYSIAKEVLVLVATSDEWYLHHREDTSHKNVSHVDPERHSGDILNPQFLLTVWDSKHDERHDIIS